MTISPRFPLPFLFSYCIVYPVFFSILSYSAFVFRLLSAAIVIFVVIILHNSSLFPFTAYVPVLSCSVSLFSPPFSPIPPSSFASYQLAEYAGVARKFVTLEKVQLPQETSNPFPSSGINDALWPSYPPNLHPSRACLAACLFLQDVQHFPHVFVVVQPCLYPEFMIFFPYLTSANVYFFFIVCCWCLRQW